MVVADDNSGESIDSEERTSSGMFLTKRQVRTFEFYYVVFAVMRYLYRIRLA